MGNKTDDIFAKKVIASTLFFSNTPSTVNLEFY